jgi:hypothetical protein
VDQTDPESTDGYVELFHDGTKVMTLKEGQPTDEDTIAIDGGTVLIPDPGRFDPVKVKGLKWSFSSEVVFP